MSKKCSGCGTTLQTTDKEKIGYIREDKYKDSTYCERCFKIIHYNEKSVTELKNINEYILDSVNKKAKYVYFLIDFLNLNEETISTFKKIKCPKTLIISKLDIIPKSIKKDKVVTFIKEVYNVTEPVLFQSTKKNVNTKSIISNLEKLNIKECYVLGYTNAGKSTLINKLNELNETKLNDITTSLIPNTTVDFIKMNINGINIIDSPGFTMKNTIYKPEEFSLIKKVNPKSFLKPTTYQVKDITSILIEDKIRLKSSIHNSFTFYISNDINIERIFDNKDTLKDLKETKLHIPANSDLVIKSLGFINIKKECTLTINTEQETLIEVRQSMF